MIITLEKNGIVEYAPIGFSWTVFFFSIFVPLLRGDFKGFFIMLIVNILTGGLSLFIFPFIYNNMYISSLLRKGYSKSGSKPININIQNN